MCVLYRTAYSDDDVQRIIGACNNSRERILMILILRGALRRIEIAKLRKEDINGRELEFLAKGGDRRKALIPEWAADEVRSYCSTTSGPWMFPSPFKKCRGKHVNTSTLSSWANDIAKRAGFDTFKTHSGRYSLATEMYRRGANIRSIQSQLGHKSQRTTELYIQRIDELVMADYDRCFA